MIRFACVSFCSPCVFIATEVEAFRKIVFYNPLCSIYTQLQMLISFFTQKLKIYCVYYTKESVINGNECFGSNCLVHHFTGGNAYGRDDDTIPSPEVSSFLLLMHNLNWFLLLPADGYYYSW